MTRKSSFIESEHFWTAIWALEGLNQEVCVDELASRLEIQASHIMDVVFFLHHLHCHFELKKSGEKTILVPPKSMPKIQVDFSLTQWLALQAHFPLLESGNNNFMHKVLIEKLSEVEVENKDFNLFEAALNLEDHLENTLKQDDKLYLEVGPKIKIQEGPDVELEEVLKCAPYSLQLIDYAIVHKVVLEITFHNQKNVRLMPLRLVYLGAELCVIGEEIGGVGLAYYFVKEIQIVCPDHSISIIPKWSSVDIDNFISGMRVVNESAVRLILKVNLDLGPPFLPEHHFLENLVMITNPRGETIWAATVETCDDLFRWLASLGGKIEILDPVSFKEEFSKYLVRENNLVMANEETLEQKLKKSV